jgi:hypothetical protein
VSRGAGDIPISLESEEHDADIDDVGGLDDSDVVVVGYSLSC